MANPLTSIDSFRKSDVLTVTIKVSDLFKIRIMIAIFLIKTAALILGCSIDINEKKE